jgi:hypothetical protein
VTVLSTIWGGTEITTTRVVLAVVAEAVIIVYLLVALRLFGR